MFGIENFIVFLTTGLLLNLYPGPDSMYIIARSMSQGRLAGVFAVLGIGSGSLFHTIIGSIGLSALLLSSVKAFMLIKYAGAIYLFYQAVLMIKDSIGETSINRIEIPNKSLFKTKVELRKALLIWAHYTTKTDTYSKGVIKTWMF